MKIATRFDTMMTSAVRVDGTRFSENSVEPLIAISDSPEIGWRPRSGRACLDPLDRTPFEGQRG